MTLAPTDQKLYAEHGAVKAKYFNTYQDQLDIQLVPGDGKRTTLLQAGDWLIVVKFSGFLSNTSSTLKFRSDIC